MELECLFTRDIKVITHVMEILVALFMYIYIYIHTNFNEHKDSVFASSLRSARSQQFIWHLEDYGHYGTNDSTDSILEEKGTTLC